MIPPPDQIESELRGSFRGELRFDAVTRGLYATDASSFQVLPLAVAIPCDEADISALLSYCHERQIPVTARGAGTGLAGESLSWGVIVDLCKAFRRIIAIANDSVTVEPGVVLAELNQALASHGKRFAPDPASGATCTVGGMIATNASGSNAFRYGYTRDYVLSVRVVWDDGEIHDFTSAPGPRTIDILQSTRTLLRTHQQVLKDAQPLTAFNRCGYLIHDLTDAKENLNLPRLLCGSEGTLGIITQATLRTIPLPGGLCYTLLGFGHLEAALQAGLQLRSHQPILCDLLDQRMLSLSRSGSGWPTVVPPGVGAALVVAWESDSIPRAEALARSAVEQLRLQHRLAVLVEPTCEADKICRIQAARSAAVSGLYGLGPGRKPVAGIEDIGVPADALPEFLTRLQDLHRQMELSASVLVHVLTGQVHARPFLDLNLQEDREKLWPLAEAVHALALSLGGTVSSQHGTGIARTPWVERQYGAASAVFRELKRIFDPRGILNPGKIIGPDPSRPAWPLRDPLPVVSRPSGSMPSPKPLSPGSASWELSVEEGVASTVSGAKRPLLVWSSSEEPQVQASRCNGCGDCRPRVRGERTCPMFEAGPDERVTPRAKVNLQRWLAGPYSGLLMPADVTELAALCVNCKMCRELCHAHIDVPKLMLETKAALQAEHGLDWQDWILARLESLTTLASNFAPIVNALLERPSIRWLLEALLGIARQRRLPAFTSRSFLKRARGAGWSRKPRPASSLIRRLPNNAIATPNRQAPVALYVDVFANVNDPLIAEAAVAVLKHHGVPVYVPPDQVGSGMAALTLGDIETARAAARQNVRVFADLVREGYQIVTLEPTSALMLKEETLHLLDDADASLVANATVEMMTYLWNLHGRGQFRTDFSQPFQVTLGHHVPCHQKALHSPSAGPDLLMLIPGVRVLTIDVSCSGMAGVYGLRAAHLAHSLQAGRPMLEQLQRPAILFGSTECSACRLQMQQGSGKRTLHPVQYLAYAYGLMPEIGYRLRKPLGDLLSD